MPQERERLVAMIDPKQKKAMATHKRKTGESEAAQVREALTDLIAKRKKQK